MAKKQTPGNQILGTVADYQRTFSTEHGRRTLRRMMHECGMDQPSFVEGDPYGTALNEGKRAAVLDIINKLKIDLTALEKIYTERDQVDPEYIE